MLRRLDRAAARRTHLEVTASEFDIGATGGHPDDLLVGGGGDLPHTRRHRHIPFRIDLGIVMLGLDQHLPVMGDGFDALLMREQRDAFPRIQIEALSRRLL